jgi:O-antigen/teichoic acid export membrane protein
MKKQLISGTIFKLLERFTFIVISLLLTPFLINNLGLDGYGFWLLALSILGWFNVIDLGFPAAVQRNIILALELNDERKLNVVFATSMVLFTLLGAISAFSLIGISNFAISLFGSESESLSIVLTIFALKVFLDFFMNSFHGFYSAFLRYDIDSNLTSLNVIIKSGLIIILVPFYGIWGAVFATIFADILTNILKVYYAKKLYPPLSFNIKYFSFEEARSLFSYSKHVIAAGVARTINLRADPFIINKLLDLTAVATYGVANRLAMHVRAFAFTINDMLTPIFIKKSAKNENMENMFHNAININFFTTSLLFTPLIILGHYFIMLWVGEQFKDTIYIIYFIIFSFLCRVISSSINQILFAQAKHKLISIISLIGAIFNIILSIVFASYYGLIGIAMGTSIGFFISDVVLSLILLKRYNPYDITPVVINFIKATAFIFVIGLTLKYYVEENFLITWLNIITLGFTAFLFCFILSWFLILNKRLRNVSLIQAQKLTTSIKKRFI